jgi:hypothetical protein
MKTTLQPITNSISSLSSRRMFVLIAVVDLALSPMMQAVVPTPDGGYPGGNTAEGDNALFTLTTGTSDTAIGFAALGSNTTGDFNTAEGSGALLLNTTGSSNTANGNNALFHNTTGFQNVATGV